MLASWAPLNIDLAKERLGVAVLHEALLDQQHHRVDVARRARRIDERHRLAAQVLERLDAGILAHVDPREERRLPVPLVLRDDHRLRFTVGEDVTGGMHEREIGRRLRSASMTAA